MVSLVLVLFQSLVPSRFSIIRHRLFHRNLQGFWRGGGTWLTVAIAPVPQALPTVAVALFRLVLRLWGNGGDRKAHSPGFDGALGSEPTPHGAACKLDCVVQILEAH